MSISFFYTHVIMYLHQATYNCHGHGPDKLQYISKLCENYDIILVQEHWLFDSQLDVFEKHLKDIRAHGVSGMTNNELLSGRPYGGLAILWHNSLRAKIEPVSTSSHRLCAIKICQGDNNILICNVYMPCDVNHVESNNNFDSVLSEISVICEQQCCNQIIIGGDLNTDLSRINSYHTKKLKSFVDHEYLRFALNHPNCKGIDFSYESKIDGSRSLVDHFIVSENLYNHISDYSGLSEGDNLSDHSVVYIKLSIDVTYFSVTAASSKDKLQWEDASDIALDNYKHKLDCILFNVFVPNEALDCNDYFCSNSKHLSDIKLFHNSIINACLESSFGTIPSRTGSKKNKVIPGWNKHVEEHRQRSLFWHYLWKENKCPREGIIANIRRTTRANYHRVVKSVKKNKEKHTSSNLADALLENDNRNFWKEIRKLRSKSNIYPNTVDGVVGESDISKLFASKYNDLYNSVSYKEADMCHLLHDINAQVADNCCHGNCYNSHIINASQVADCIVNLKHGKSDGSEGHTTDHLIYGTNRLNVMLALLFTSMLTHGFTPNEFLLSTIISIPKSSRKSLNSSDNYRGIALNSVIGKLFDWILLKSNYHVLQSSDLQFGFKSKHSTTQCTFIVNEVIQYYRNGNSPVHVMLLDASKAFDCVHYVKLYTLLLKKGLCPLVARLLVYMYTHQTVQVRWGSTMSDTFSISNGVKQA